MKTRNHPKPPVGVLLTALLCSLCLISATFGEVKIQEIQPALTQTDMPEPSDYVSIQVDGGTIRQVLNAFAIQTQRNVVIGPEVVSEDVSIHLNNVWWDEALEVILKPYGYGYRTVGETIVISKLENLASLEAVEPLQTKVYNLQFVDAGDVKEMLEGQLSPRGRMSIMIARGQKGWEFAGRGSGRSYSQSGTTLAKRVRIEDKEQQSKSKTIVVTDIPGVLDKIDAVLAKVDIKPTQILVEAKFVEVNENYLRDIGLELTGADIGIGGSLTRLSDAFYQIEPNAFNPASSTISGTLANTYGQAQFNSGAVDLLLKLLQEDDDSQILSAPRVLTLNNQEATIIVGQKYPIIESDVTGATQIGITSTTLDYYENIGIQLNVVPQTSGDGYINMIVHPSVSSIAGFATGATGSQVSTNASQQTLYPIINTREAETQILLKDSETIVIGGLLEDREGTTVLKVPFLGDIPILGHLFRRTTDNSRTVDLLIFITASVVDLDTYSVPEAEIVIVEEAEEPAQVSEEMDVPEPPEMETEVPNEEPTEEM